MAKKENETNSKTKFDFITQIIKNGRMNSNVMMKRK